MIRENTLNLIEEMINQQLYDDIVGEIIRPDFENIIDKALLGASQEELKTMCESFCAKYKGLFSNN